MLSEILNRIERRLDVLGLSAAGASRQAGLSADAIRNMQRAAEKDDRQGVSTATLTKLAPVLQTTASWLLDGAGPEDASDRLVPIIGYVGADTDGTVLMAAGQGAGEFVAIQPGADPASSALGVRGHALKGFADDNGLIFFGERAKPSRELLGHVVVVETGDGRTLVKRLLKGSHPGVYDLESIVGPTLEDVEIRWAALVTAIVPPAQAKKIIVRNGDHQAA